MPSDLRSHFSVSRSLPFHPFLFCLLLVPIHTYTLLLLCLDGGPMLYDIQHSLLFYTYSRPYLFPLWMCIHFSVDISHE